MTNFDNFQNDFYEFENNNDQSEHNVLNHNGNQNESMLSIVDCSVPQYFFSENHDRIFLAKKTKNGYETITIANFCVWISKEEITYDEFGNVTRIYTIQGKNENGKQIEPFKIDAAEFSEMKWVDTYLGKDCYIYDRQRNKYKVLEAIQRHPYTFQSNTETVYSYTGWIKSDKSVKYLFPNFSKEKYNLDVSLTETLKSYFVPFVKNEEEKKEGLKRSLMFLNVGNSRVTFPLLATMYLAPLASFVNIDFSVWVHGETGSLKTTLTKHIMHHFGKFDTHAITWNSTSNAIERYASTIGDAPLVIDDYAPQPDQASQNRLDQTVERVIRDAGNNTGRARMKANLSLQHIYHKRGIIIATGEQLPKSQSILARLYGISLSKEDINIKELSNAQENFEKYYGFATSAYIEWIENVGAQKVKEIFENAEKTFFKFSNENLHASQISERIKRTSAKLYAAFEVMLQMMLEHKIVEQREVDNFKDAAKNAIAANIINFEEDFSNESILQKTFETIETMLHTRQVAIVSVEDAKTAQYIVPIIGYVDNKSVYLLWNVAYDQILKYVKSIGGSFTHTKLATQKSIRQALNIEKTTLKRVGSTVKRVLEIPLDTLKEKGFSFFEDFQNQNQTLPSNF